MSTTFPVMRRWVAASLIALLTGCTTWHTTTVSPGALITEERPSTVRATLADGGTVTIVDPIMRNDSIVSPDPGLPGVAARDISLLEVLSFSPVRTVVLVAGIVVVAVSWAAAVSSGRGGSEDPIPLPKDSFTPIGN